MKTHTNNFKSVVKRYGRELDVIISYTLNNETIELGVEELNSVVINYEGNILKSVMKELDIDSNVSISKDTIIDCQIGLKVNGSYEYLDYGSFIVYSIEKQEDTNSYKITCYDKMLYSMVDYEAMNIIYPITIRNYINAICTKLGLTFKNASDTFVNYDKEIQNELFLTTTGGSLGFTFRDVLDQLAEVTASTICIDENGQLEIRYIKDTQGKNLLNMNKFYKGTWRKDYVSVKKQDYGLKLTCLQNGTQRWFPAFVLDDSVLGKTITLSAKITDSNGQKAKVAFYWANMDNLVYSSSLGQIDGSGTNKEIKLTISVPSTLPTGQTNLVVFLYAGVTSTSVNDYVVYDELMLEVGDTKTEFELFGDTIDEDFLKDVNVKFGEKYGVVNSIVLSRAGESDNVYLRDEESVIENGLCEIKIIENQIMNFNDRATYLSGILNQLDGLEYYVNDFFSTGILYYDLCDKYNVKIGDNTYSCVMFNDSIDLTNGLEENIYTEMPDKSETDYKKADKTDRRINQAYVIVDKQNQEIESLTRVVEDVDRNANNTYQQVLEKLGEVDEKIVDVDTIEYVVRQLQTNTYTKQEIQQIVNGVGVDGVKVTAVQTTSATFDEDGMLYEKTNAPTKTQINQVGVNVKDRNNNSLLFAGYVDSNNTDYPDYASQSIVGTDNIIVKNYLNIGTHSRIQDYNNGTGIFYMD